MIPLQKDQNGKMEHAIFKNLHINEKKITEEKTLLSINIRNMLWRKKNMIGEEVSRVLRFS